ncbi:MAG: APC family permease [Chloroflexi bacterium]|nr:APC family permease [Chloroflexota bacterium]
MAAQEANEVKMVPTLGLTGVTINAMALIAPGAFLWTTFASQSTNGAMNMWASVLLAIIIALFTAISYAALAKRYPEAGAGSSYYFAEVAVLHKEEHRHFRFARLSKFIVGWASHLYYWIYPGVMIAYMGTLVAYIIQTFVPDFGTPVQLVLTCIVSALVVGFIAYIGINGSTMTNVIINIIQIVMLLVFSIIAIFYRITHPGIHYLHPTPLSVITPHDLNGLIFQSTIAILLIVGFESATALAAEAKNPGRDIPRGVIISLIIQGVICYLFEYFAANFAIGDYYKSPDGKLTGFDAAAASGAPIGDIAKYLGDQLFHGGTAFATIMALTVFLALLGTTLACLNTGVRVTYAMGKDSELPTVFGFLHGKYRTPHVGVIVLTVLSAALGSYGILKVDNLLQITLMSNIGTFLLYGMTCLICVVAFAGVAGRAVFNTLVAPILGAALNILMLIFVLYYAIAGGGSGQVDTIIAGVVAIAWLVLGFAYLYIQKIRTGTPILHPEDYKKASDDVAVPAASGD